MAKLAIPTSAKEMQEMMDDPKVAAQIIQEGQWTEFNRAYATATDTRGEMSQLVREAVTAAWAGGDELTNRVETSVRDIVSTLMKEQGVNRPQVGADAHAAAARNPLAPGAPLSNLGFANIGDYARTVFNKGRQNDPRMAEVIKVMDAYSSTDPASAGFLIPEDVRSTIYELALEQEVIRPRASIIQMSTAKTILPYVDQTTHVGSVFGGMTFTWVDASTAVAPTEAKFGRVGLEASKLMGTARVPNELWADAPALSTFLMRSIPAGIAFYEDVAFFSGIGVGQPLGLLDPGNTAKITVAKEASQTTATIILDNILKMYSRMLPQSLQNSVWIANPTTFPELMKLSITVGTGGNSVMLVDLHAAPNLAMLGRPLILTEKVPALGATGDIGLYDVGYYLVGDRQAISLESSEHVRFATDETELRCILRVDGRPWIQSALTPLNGDSLSPFVVLAARP